MPGSIGSPGLTNGTGANGLIDAPNSLQARLEAFRDLDNQRGEFIQALVTECTQLRRQLRDAESDLHSEKLSRREYFDRFSYAEAEIQQLKSQSDHSPFALVLIDGDGTIFQDHLLERGADGGSEAAHLLLSELRAKLKDRYPSAAPWSVVVNIYANLDDLARKLYSIKIINKQSDLQDFARGFTISQPLFNFIDIGRGKERADHKLREMYRLFVYNSHCKAIFWAGTHDNGYLPTLEPYKRDALVADRMTLLEGTPAEPPYRGLGYPIVRFPNVFREEALTERNFPGYVPAMPMRPKPETNVFATSIAEAGSDKRSPVNAINQSSMQSPTTPTQALLAASVNRTFTPQPPPAPQSPQSPAPTNSSYAKVGDGTNDAKRINIAPDKPWSRPCIYLNKESQRLDPPLKKPELSGEARLKMRLNNGKLCNMFHLLGKCKNGESCHYQHGERLGPQEQLALSHRTRTTLCPRRSDCWDVHCILGHHCPNPKCERRDCFFQDLHHKTPETAKPAMRVFEDETFEMIQPNMATSS